MSRNVNSKYKVDRRRTRRQVVELVDSDSDPSVAGENDEEYNIHDDALNESDDDDEAKLQNLDGKRRSRRRATNPNPKYQHGEEHDPDTSDNEETNEETISATRKSPRLRLKEESATPGNPLSRSKHLALGDTSDDDEEDKRGDTRSSKRRSTKVSSTRRRQSERGIKSGDVLANLPCPPSIRGRLSALETKRKSKKIADEETEDDSNQSSDDDDDDDVNGLGSENEKDSDYDDEEENEIDQMLDNTRKKTRRTTNKRRTTRRSKRKKAAHSSDEEFVLDSDDDSDDSSKEFSLSDDESAQSMNVDNDITMIGDQDLSDDDSDDQVVMPKGKRNNHATSTNVVNVDEENIGTIDDDSESEDSSKQKSSPNVPRSAGKGEILPSPLGVNGFESDDTADNNEKRKLRNKPICPKCPSKEDAITLEPLSRLHVCYITPDGKSRSCFNLETLRQIALKSSKLELRVDLDAERQNFLQPPAFRTAMSDNLLDQIASKFGRGALDLQGPYYKNRERKYQRNSNELSEGDDGEFSLGSNSSGGADIYESFETFRDRLKNYFKNGMGSQDIYVCPLCYGRIHRTLVDPKITGSNTNDDEDSDDDDDDDDDDDAAAKEYDAAASDSVYDPITVLGYLDNDEMSIASQFCFKKLADVKKHLREEHNVDTRGLQGNELYKRFRVRAPDGLLQRFLSTQVRSGQVKQGHMRMYWGQGNDQLYIQLLDLMEQVRVYSAASDDSSEEGDSDDEMNEHANKARKFFNTFARKASKLWEIISSPFLKSNDNVNDFIAREDDYSEEEDSGGQPHATLHQQFMNEDSDENDLVHKLQRKYAEQNDADSTSRNSSSTEEELEFVDNQKESDHEEGDNDDDDQDIYNRNGYYSPIEEEKDEWMLERQSERKRKSSSTKKEKSDNSKMKTPRRKKLFRRKSTPTVTSSSTIDASKKKRMLTLEDSSDED